MERIRKYPRTAHVQGSRLQHGDEDLSQVRFSDIASLHLVVEEKMDGANAGISFDASGQMFLQSRGHYLVGGPRERHWDMFKRWAAAHESQLLTALEDRYILYGEWLYAKHTVFYDLLPHYFMEFDVLDRETGGFLDTTSRRELLRDVPIVPVSVLHSGPLPPGSTVDDLAGLIRPSYFKSGLWRRSLVASAAGAGVSEDAVIRQTDMSDDMEGLYIKVEEGGVVKQRLKWVRGSFTSSIADQETHWLDRPIVPNRLAPFADIFSG